MLQEKNGTFIVFWPGYAKKGTALFISLHSGIYFIWVRPSHHSLWSSDQRGHDALIDHQCLVTHWAVVNRSHKTDQLTVDVESDFTPLVGFGIFLLLDLTAQFLDGRCLPLAIWSLGSAALVLHLSLSSSTCSTWVNMFLWNTPKPFLLFPIVSLVLSCHFCNVALR